MDSQNQIDTMGAALFNKYNTVVVTTEQLSEITGQSIQTLKNNRMNSVGIPYVKLGSSVRYNVYEIAKYLVDNTIVTNTKN